MNITRVESPFDEWWYWLDNCFRLIILLLNTWHLVLNLFCPIFISAPLGSSTTWCKLAYWEECCRVGPLVTVTKPWVGVTSSPTPTSKKKHPGQAGSDHLSSPATNSKFSPKQSTASPKGDGEELSLNSLFSQNHNASESTRKLRDKIGKGILNEAYKHFFSFSLPPPLKAKWIDQVAETLNFCNYTTTLK